MVRRWELLCRYGSFPGQFLSWLYGRDFFLNNSNVEPKILVRYVDVIFGVFDKVTEFQHFLDHINNKHVYIKFTIEGVPILM